MAFDAARGVVLLFGSGASSSVCDTCSRVGAETWTWDGTRWRKLHPAASPTPRTDASVAYDAIEQTIVLFGGLDRNGSPLGDTWTWDGATWTQLQLYSSPSPRARARMAFDSTRQEILLYGGVGQGSLTDSWTWDGISWTQLNPPQAPGAPADPHLMGGMAFDAATQSTVLYGGCAGTSATPPTYTFDGATWAAHAVTGPRGMCGPSMSYDATHHLVVLFGGNPGDGTTPSGETWSWDGFSWTKRSPAASPTPRYHALTAYDSTRGMVVVFGGLVLVSGTLQSGTIAATNDTWGWNGTTWTLLAPGTPPR
jgi:hypothetical protein